MAQPDLTCVEIYQGVLTAEIAKSKLEAAGIPALLKYESAGLVFGLTVDGLGEVRLLVPAELAEEARALLSEMVPEEEDQEEIEEQEPAPDAGEVEPDLGVDEEGDLI